MFQCVSDKCTFAAVILLFLSHFNWVEKVGSPKCKCGWIGRVFMFGSFVAHVFWSKFFLCVCEIVYIVMKIPSKNDSDRSNLFESDG